MADTTVLIISIRRGGVTVTPFHHPAHAAITLVIRDKRDNRVIRRAFLTIFGLQRMLQAAQNAKNAVSSRKTAQKQPGTRK